MIAQSVAQGTQVRKGTTVRLTIGQSAGDHYDGHDYTDRPTTTTR